MNETAIQSDGELLAAYVDDGSAPSFAELVRRHAVLVRGVCQSILQQHDDADDATQAAFLTLARKAPQLRRHPTIAGWLHRVAWHVSMRARESRDLRRRRERDVSDQQLRCGMAQSDEPDSDAEVRAIVHEALASLPEKYRVPLVLHHLQGWSEAEIASMLGAKMGTISGQLSRGRAMLRDRLDRRGFALGAAAMLAPLPGSASGAQAGEINAILSAVSSRGLAAPRVSALSASAVRMLGRSRRVALRVGILLAGLLLLAPFMASRFGLSFPAMTSAVATKNVGEISGVIVNPTRRATANVTVRLYASEATARANRPPVATSTSDAKGVFLFDGVRPVNNYYVLCFIQEPEFMHAARTVNVKAGENTNLGEIVLQTDRY